MCFTSTLLCNPKKYEIDVDHLNISCDSIKFSNSVKNPGVHFDDDLSMNAHVMTLSKAVYIEIRRLKHISNFVYESSLKTLAASLILSRFDYCSSLFKKLNASQTYQLQKLHNFAAKVICDKSLRDHATPCLMYLHWLPIAFRIDFKIAMLVFKCLNGLAPPYLCDLLELYKSVRILKSSDKFHLKVVKTKYVTLGDKSFSHSAPLVWNNLLLDLRKEKSISILKANLKLIISNLHSTKYL